MSFPRSISRDTACIAVTTVVRSNCSIGASHRAGRPQWSLLFESRVELVQLLHLAPGAPPEIARARVSEVTVTDRLEAAIEVEPTRDFVGYSLIVNETVITSRQDRFFVETLGVQLPAFNARDLCGDQRCAAPEVGGAALRPNFKLLVVSCQCRRVLRPFLIGHRVAMSHPRERCMEVEVRHLDARWHRPEKPLCLLCSLEGRCLISCVEPRLQLTNPISASGVR